MKNFIMTIIAFGLPTFALADHFISIRDSEGARALSLVKNESSSTVKELGHGMAELNLVVDQNDSKTQVRVLFQNEIDAYKFQWLLGPLGKKLNLGFIIDTTAEAAKSRLASQNDNINVRELSTDTEILKIKYKNRIYGLNEFLDVHADLIQKNAEKAELYQALMALGQLQPQAEAAGRLVDSREQVKTAFNDSGRSFPRDNANSFYALAALTLYAQSYSTDTGKILEKYSEGKSHIQQSLGQ